MTVIEDRDLEKANNKNKKIWSSCCNYMYFNSLPTVSLFLQDYFLKKKVSSASLLMYFQVTHRRNALSRKAYSQIWLEECVH